MDFDERRWNLFVHLCDKQNLDLKGDSIRDYAANFESAFMKANNIVMMYDRMKDKQIKKDKYGQG